MSAADDVLMSLAQAIGANDEAGIERLLADGTIAALRLGQGATRQIAKAYFIGSLQGYVVAGDTALHMTAAAYRCMAVQSLGAAGADVRARNRLGAEPLHSAASGGPGSQHWNPSAQAATIACLITAGADPNALDKRGVAPLHRAVRMRCAAAVQALLEGGADPGLRNPGGSTPMLLATQTTGRGGSGSPEAKAEQQRIVQLLMAHRRP